MYSEGKYYLVIRNWLSIPVLTYYLLYANYITISPNDIIILSVSYES